MLKRFIATLLALAALPGLSPVAVAAAETETWSIFWEVEDGTLECCVVPPEDYTQAAPDAKAAFSVSDETATQTLQVALQGSTVDYYSRGTCAPHLILRGKTAITPEQRGMRISWYIPADTALRADGSGNDADPELQYGFCFGSMSLRVCSNLSGAEFEPYTGHPAAVGDRMTLTWQGVFPAEIYLDGEPLTTVYAGDAQTCSWTEKQKGDHVLTAVYNGQTIDTELYSTVSSRENYRDNLKQSVETLPALAALPVGLLGVPVLNGFIPLLWPAAIVYGFIDFVKTLFSFTRIKR